MICFIDFIRHGNAVLPEGITDDRDRILSPLGIRQARAFGAARQAADEKYILIVLSGLIRTEQTTDAIIETLSHGSARIAVPEMFDPEKPDAYSEQRQAAYEEMGSRPLGVYQDQCLSAMVDLGLNAAKELRPICKQASGSGDNILVIGHGVYTNEIILDTFLEDLRPPMKQRLLNDPPLAECAGYRLLFDDDGNLRDMIRLPTIILDV